MHSIDRKAAARLLKVSMRTVDRYIMSKKLSTLKKDGRIWLDKKEISAVARRKAVDMVDKVSTSVDTSIDTVDMVSTLEKNVVPNQQQSAENIYKQLYEELKEVTKTQQERLEGANYRVGQLEALVKESVPLLDHQRLLSEEKAMRFELEENVETLRDKLERMYRDLRDEKFNKKIFLVILFVILLLQPVWVYLLVGP
jgi:hypothetical protein